MIDFELDFQYENEKIPALRNVKGRIEDGKCIVLCGGSGSGKSTLIKCINRLIPQFYEGELNGFCHIGGSDIGGMSVGEAGKFTASVFQDPRSQFFTINSSTEVAFGLENHGVSCEEMRRRVNEAFSVFHLEKLKDRNVYELSSGERQLVSILSAWAMDTDILLFDEPTANLDYAAIKELGDLLGKLKACGKTMLISEHRLYYLSGIADEYWLMEDGQIRKRCTEEEIKDLQKENGIPLRTLALEDVVFSAKPPVEMAGSMPFMFGASGLCFGYKRKGGEILKGVSFQAHGGEAVGIIGSNGSGKTTMGKLLAGLLPLSAGDIFYNGKKMKRREMQKKALFVMQESEFQFYTNSVMNELRYGHKETPEFQKEAERLLKKFGMWECRNRHPFALSGGQMQKLSLMIAYFSPKQIVILDEPTAGLDAGSLKSCAELIREMQHRKLVFVITHDIELIAQACTRCICIADGKTEREISLERDAQIKKLVDYMEGNFQMETLYYVEDTGNRKCRLHPSVKLLFWLAAMAVVSISDNSLLFSVYAALILMVLADGWPALAFAGGGAMALLLGFDNLFSHTAVSFFAIVLFPRIMAVGLSMYPLMGRDEAPRTIACLRALHTPETLSASAETRGIALDGKRSSYVRLSFRLRDFLFFLLLVAALVIGFIR